jgi:hypothetical protein
MAFQTLPTLSTSVFTRLAKQCFPLWELVYKEIDPRCAIHPSLYPPRAASPSSRLRCACKSRSTVGSTAGLSVLEDPLYTFLSLAWQYTSPAYMYSTSQGCLI